MRVLVTGAGGQLGRELVALAPAGTDLLAAGRADLDVADAAAVDRFMDDARPDVVINAAAFTGVDAAEHDSEAAHRVNGLGPGHLAGACARLGARLVHVSTDYVFAGRRPVPHAPQDKPEPLGVYGMTKLEGEQAVTRLLPDAAVIVRTAWLYSRYAANFTNTMLRLMRKGQPIRVVYDQTGSPTSCLSLSRALWRAASRSGLRGILHWTDAGVASWYDLAVSLQEEARRIGLIDRPVEITPVLTREFPRDCRRPAYGVLDCASSEVALGLKRVHWRTSLIEMLEGGVDD